MSLNSRILYMLFMLGLALLANGCAGTARGLTSSVYEHDESLVAIDTSRSEADALVVIRYPALVDEEAEIAYYRAFERHAIGGQADLDSQRRRDRERIAQSLLAKSAYFAMSLYRELKARLPDDAVLLSPHMVRLDADGRLGSGPLLASEQIPTVITIDFSVYSFPDIRKMMNAEPLTFGDIVTPLFVVHANRWLMPSTHGLLLASESLAQTAWLQSESQAGREARARTGDTQSEENRPLDFIRFLQWGNRGSRDLPLKSAGAGRRDLVAVEIHPLEKIRLDGDLMAGLLEEGSPDPFADDFVKGAVTRVLTALNAVDHDRATFFARQRALGRFDPELAGAFLAGSRDGAMRARLRMGEALLTAERKFLAAQSGRLYEGAYDGEYGAGMRQMIAAEYRLLEERRDLARAQNAGTALAVLTMAGAVYAGGSDSSFQSQTMSNVLAFSSMWAASAAIRRNAESKSIGANFLLQMAPAINRQVSVQLEWLDTSREISAADFGSLREQTLALYQEHVRSMNALPARDCVFRQPQFEPAGRWFGPCENGLATGNGYGVLVAENGDRVEYLGAAERGMAGGVGAMILQRGEGMLSSDVGATYLEGGFADGLPAGVVRIERPGRKPRTRHFEAGIDRGSADGDDVPRLRF